MTKKSTTTVKTTAKGKARGPANKAKDRQLAIKDEMTMAVSTAPVANSRHIKRRGMKVTRVVKTERITGVAPLGADVLEIQINPGRDAVFPYLSGIARLYSKYRFRRLKLSYTPQVPTTQGGTLTVGFDYDSTLGVTPTPQNIAQLEDFALTPVWSSLDVTIDCPQDYRYVKAVSPPENIDLYDVGSFYVMTEATGALATAPGYFTLSYEVELIHPQPEGSNGYRVPAEWESLILVPTVKEYEPVPAGSATDRTSQLSLWGSGLGGLDLTLQTHNVQPGMDPILSWDPVTRSVTVSQACILTFQGTFFLEESDWLAGTQAELMCYIVNSANEVNFDGYQNFSFESGNTSNFGSFCCWHSQVEISGNIAHNGAGLTPKYFFRNASFLSDISVLPRLATPSVSAFVPGYWTVTAIRS